MEKTTDSELVNSARAGDGDAFATLYDRYADRIHTFAFSRLRDTAASADALQTTFISAHRRLDQLRDPARFRPWLFAIARTTIIDQARLRARPDAPTAGEPDLMGELPDEQPGPERGLEAAESGALLWSAAAALQPRDQELLELHLREGLEGADLAEAMDVDVNHVYVMVKRLKDRLSTAVGSLLVARSGRKNCPELDALLDNWDGAFSLAVRSRVTRHVEGCDTCRRTRKAAISWEGIAAAMPSAPAPAVVRGAILAATGAVVGSGAIGGGGMAGAGALGTTTGPVATGAAATGAIGAVASVVTTMVATIAMLAWPVASPERGPDVEVAGVAETSTTTTTAAPQASIAGGAQPATTSEPAPTSTAAPIPSLAITAPTTTTTRLPLPALPTTPPPTGAPPVAATTTTSTTTTTAPVPVAATTTTSTTSTSTTSTSTTTTSTVPPLGPILVVDTATMDFGDDPLVTTLDLIIGNDGDTVDSWSATITPPIGEPAQGFSMPAGNKGSTQPGLTAPLSIAFDRTHGEGDYTSTLNITSPGGTATVVLIASIELAPHVSFVFDTDPIWDDAGTCAGGATGLPTWTTVIAIVADESPLDPVVATWDGVMQTILELDASDPSGTTYKGIVGPWAPIRHQGAVLMPVSVTGTDSRGNTTTTTNNIEIHGCPG